MLYRHGTLLVLESRRASGIRFVSWRPSGEGLPQAWLPPALISAKHGAPLSLCSSCSQDGCQSTCLQHLDPLTETFRREGRSLPRSPKPITHESSGAAPPPLPRPRGLGQRKEERVTARPAEEEEERVAPGRHRCGSVSWGEARGPGGARGEEGCDRVAAEPPPLSPPFLVPPRLPLPPALTFPGLTPPPKPRGPGGGHSVLHAPRRHG